MYGLFGNKQFLKLYFCTYTTIQKFGVSYIYIYIFKEINTFIQHWWIKLIKRDSVKKMFSSI